MDSETKIVIPEQVMSRQVGDETVILDLQSGTYFGLDPVGARIWQLLIDGHRLGGVVTALLGEFDVREDEVLQDVNALVTELATRGLVQISQ